jgi:hypothetical protein
MAIPIAISRVVYDRFGLKYGEGDFQQWTVHGPFVITVMVGRE